MGGNTAGDGGNTAGDGGKSRVMGRNTARDGRRWAEARQATAEKAGGWAETRHATAGDGGNTAGDGRKSRAMGGSTARDGRGWWKHGTRRGKKTGRWAEARHTTASTQWGSAQAEICVGAGLLGVGDACTCVWSVSEGSCWGSGAQAAGFWRSKRTCGAESRLRAIGGGRSSLSGSNPNDLRPGSLTSKTCNVCWWRAAAA